VGLAIHESPRLTVKKKETLKPNMVVTVEPAVYIEGSYGVRIEDLVLLKENNIDTLSKSPKEIITL
jgi:Xaa-Pro aminopeptidase